MWDHFQCSQAPVKQAIPKSLGLFQSFGTDMPGPSFTVAGSQSSLMCPQVANWEDLIVAWGGADSSLKYRDHHWMC